MTQTDERSAAPTTDRTAARRISDRELEVTRLVAAAPARVYAAWSQADLFRQWWVPQSFGLTLLSCEIDARVGGTYRLEFGHPASDEPMAFFGRYLEAVPNERLSWTNDESDEGAVTTVTFKQQGEQTLMTVHELFPSKEALDAEIASGACEGLPESLDQLDHLLATNR